MSLLECTSFIDIDIQCCQTRSLSSGFLILCSCGSALGEASLVVLHASLKN